MMFITVSMLRILDGLGKNGEKAGTAGLAYRLEGILIKHVPKGGAAPGSTADAFIHG